MFSSQLGNQSLEAAESEIKSGLIPADVVDVNDREAAMHAMQNQTKRKAIFDYYRDHCVKKYGIDDLPKAQQVINEKVLPHLRKKLEELKSADPEYVRLSVAIRRLSGLNDDTLAGFKSSLFNLHSYIEYNLGLNLRLPQNQIFNPFVIFANQWLAATDKDMEFVDARAADVNNGEAKREDLIQASTTSFISAFVDDMCREYNPQNDSLAHRDNTSCGPGFTGKLFLNLNRFNKKAVMPLPKGLISFGPLKEDIKNFIIDQITTLPNCNDAEKAQIKTAAFNYLYNSAIFRTKPSELDEKSEELLQYREFEQTVNRIKANSHGLIDYLLAKHPEWQLDIYPFVEKIAKQLEIECEHLKCERDDASPDPVMIQRIYHDYFNSVKFKDLQIEFKELIKPDLMEYCIKVRKLALQLDALHFVIENELNRANLDPDYLHDPRTSLKILDYIDKFRTIQKDITDADQAFDVTYRNKIAASQQKETIIAKDAQDVGVHLDAVIAKPWEMELPNNIKERRTKMLGEHGVISQTTATLNQLEQFSQGAPQAEARVSIAKWAENFVRVAIKKSPEGNYYDTTHEIKRLLEFYERTIEGNAWRIDALLAEVSERIVAIDNSQAKDRQQAIKILQPILHDWHGALPHFTKGQYALELCLGRAREKLGANFVESVGASPSIVLDEKNQGGEISKNIGILATMACDLLKSKNTDEDKLECLTQFILLLLFKNLLITKLSNENTAEINNICGYFMGKPLPNRVSLPFMPQPPVIPTVEQRMNAIISFLTCIIKTIEPLKGQFDAGYVQIMSRDAGEKFLQSKYATEAVHPGQQLAICRLSISQPNFVVMQTLKQNKSHNILVDGTLNNMADTTGQDYLIGENKFKFITDADYLNTQIKPFYCLTTRPKNDTIDWNIATSHSYVADIETQARHAYRVMRTDEKLNVNEALTIAYNTISVSTDGLLQHSITAVLREQSISNVPNSNQGPANTNDPKRKNS